MRPRVWLERGLRVYREQLIVPSGCVVPANR